MEATACELVEMDAAELRAITGGARMWKPGYTATGDPIYGWVEE